MLELEYGSKEEIPEGYEKLYTEQGGKWVLTGVKGMKSQKDVDALTRTVTKLRTEKGELEQQLAKFSDLDADTIEEDMAELATLRSEKEAGTLGKGADESKINELVDARVKIKTAALDKKNTKLAAENESLKTKVGELETGIRQSKIKDAVRAAGGELNVIPGALEDIEIIADRLFEIDAEGNVVGRDGVGITPGTSPKDWLNEQKATKAHWWPVSQGGGSEGGKDTGGIAENPWSAEHWNLTKQGAYVTQHGEAKARDAAKRAGVNFDAPVRPKAAA